jgi:hypothetical protein
MSRQRGEGGSSEQCHKMTHRGGGGFKNQVKKVSSII